MKGDYFALILSYLCEASCSVFCGELMAVSGYPTVQVEFRLIRTVRGPISVTRATRSR